MPVFHRKAGTARHGGQELVVHLDQLVEQALARLDQIAGDQRLALRLGETPQIAGIVAPPELAELAHDARIDAFERRGVAEQVIDQVQPRQVRLDRRRRADRGVALEAEQAGACIALRHFEQQRDVDAQLLGQFAGDGHE